MDPIERAESPRYEEITAPAPAAPAGPSQPPQTSYRLNSSPPSQLPTSSVRILRNSTSRPVLVQLNSRRSANSNADHEPATRRRSSSEPQIRHLSDNVGAALVRPATRDTPMPPVHEDSEGISPDAHFSRRLALQPVESRAPGRLRRLSASALSAFGRNRESEANGTNEEDQDPSKEYATEVVNLLDVVGMYYGSFLHRTRPPLTRILIFLQIPKYLH